jgi:hypothetical protein
LASTCRSVLSRCCGVHREECALACVIAAMPAATMTNESVAVLAATIGTPFVTLFVLTLFVVSAFIV